MKPKSPEVLRDELNELIKEARTKIKPVLMSKIERDQYIRPQEEFDEMHKKGLIVNIDTRGMALLDTEKISLEVLRKIQDKKLEIDLKYEHTRDLFEKQRVVDQFLEEHQEDNKVLHGYYQNKYVQSKQNKYVKFIYNNSYDLTNVRFGLYASSFSTVFATAVLGFINPMLMPLMLYDYYLLCAFSS